MKMRIALVLPWANSAGCSGPQCVQSSRAMECICSTSFKEASFQHSTPKRNHTAELGKRVTDKVWFRNKECCLEGVNGKPAEAWLEHSSLIQL